MTPTQSIIYFLTLTITFMASIYAIEKSIMGGGVFTFPQIPTYYTALFGALISFLMVLGKGASMIDRVGREK